MPLQLSTDAAFFSSLILYQDSHMLLVYKPHGLPVQLDKSGDKSLLDYGKDYLIEHCHKPGNAYLSLPHRLDRPVAGLCLLAKTSKAMQRISGAFQQKKCQKFYLAVVENTFATRKGQQWQELCHYLRKESGHNKSYICQAGTKGAKPARLYYRNIVCGKRYSIICVRLETGRHHQIRCQLAALGHPIKGDLKYGAKRGNIDGGINLYSAALQVPMPVQSIVQSSDQRAQTGPQKAKYMSAFTHIRAARISGPEPIQVLQGICLPWQWQQHNRKPISSIWQLCMQNPNLLSELQSLF